MSVPVEQVAPGAVFQFPAGNRQVVELLNQGYDWAQVRWRADAASKRGGHGHIQLLKHFAAQAQALVSHGVPIASFATNQSEANKQRVATQHLVILRDIAKKRGFHEATEVLDAVIQGRLMPIHIPQKPANSRRFGQHATRPNRNNSSGVLGVRAFRLDRGGIVVMHFNASWRWTGANGKRLTGSKQASSETHGIHGALKLVMTARAQGIGEKPPTDRHVRAAWKIISAKLDEPS